MPLDSRARIAVHPLAEAQMASDAYLKIEGIDGESEDERHRNWIEVSNVLYAVHQPRAGVLSTAGGHTESPRLF